MLIREFNQETESSCVSCDFVDSFLGESLSAIPELTRINAEKDIERLVMGLAGK
jgi:hypothetical protein